MASMNIKAPLKLVLLRHGQSAWNLENRFTGWKNVPLSDLGREEARLAGKTLKDNNFEFDSVHTSLLKRSINTYNILADEMECQHLPIRHSWRLNERHYGELTGLNKAETITKHGEEQVKIWRRSFTVPPPALNPEDPRAPHFDPLYAHIPKQILPLSESLQTTGVRVLPYFYDNILVDTLAGKRVLVVAHGNSLRSIVKELEQMTSEQIIEYSIPTGIPLVYEFDTNLKVLKSYYLGDIDSIRKEMEEALKRGGERKKA